MGQPNQRETGSRRANLEGLDGPPGAIVTDDERRRSVYDLLGNDTRYYVLTAIVAHPDHLPSLYQLATFAGVAESTVSRGAIPTLIDAGIVDSYEVENPENPDDNGYPTTFYGFTADGIERLDAVGFFGTAGFQRGLYRRLATDKTWTRHDAADRPTLPPRVRSALDKVFGAEDGAAPTDDGVVPEPPADADSGDGDLGNLFE